MNAAQEDVFGQKRDWYSPI